MSQQTLPDSVGLTRESIAALIDHTILKADATRADIRRICAEARQYRFASVCTNSWWTPFVAELLQGSGVKVCAVAGFPLGAMSTEAKQAETRLAVRDGALEVDMVLNVGALKGGEADAVRSDIAAVVKAAEPGKAIVKVILETALLTDDEKQLACQLAMEAGADFVKTSTGFGPSGATPADVALMRDVVGRHLGVKASGGIRTLEDVRTMLTAGASRIGASASIAIIEAIGS